MPIGARYSSNSHPSPRMNNPSTEINSVLLCMNPFKWKPYCIWYSITKQFLPLLICFLVLHLCEIFHFCIKRRIDKQVFVKQSLIQGTFCILGSLRSSSTPPSHPHSQFLALFLRSHPWILVSHSPWDMLLEGKISHHTAKQHQHLSACMGASESQSN